MVAGAVSIFSNLFIAGFGYVDQYVTPLTTESKNQRAIIEAAQIGDPRFAPGMIGSADGGFGGCERRADDRHADELFRGQRRGDLGWV